MCTTACRWPCWPTPAVAPPCAAQRHTLSLSVATSFDILAANAPGQCPDGPNVTCVAPTCSGPGAQVVLTGSCVVDAGWNLVYYVDGDAAVTATCAHYGESMEVVVVPEYPGLEDQCCYEAVDAYSLDSEWHLPGCHGQAAHVARQCLLAMAASDHTHRSRTRGPGVLPLPPHPWLPAPSSSPSCPASCDPNVRPPSCPSAPTITCATPPVCSNAGDEVSLAGSCTSSDPSATLVYVVKGSLAMVAKCPKQGRARVVRVTAAYDDQPECGYDLQLAFSLSGASPRTFSEGPAARIGSYMPGGVA